MISVLRGRISRATACSCSYDRDGFHINLTGNTVPGGSMFRIQSATQTYVTSCDRALPLLLCALILAGASSVAFGAEGERPRL